MQIEDFQQNLGKIILLSCEFGITFTVFLYITNEDNNIIIHKNYWINNLISIILVYKLEDITLYLSQKNLNFKLYNNNLETMGESLNIKFPKITFEQAE